MENKFGLLCLDKNLLRSLSAVTLEIDSIQNSLFSGTYQAHDEYLTVRVLFFQEIYVVPWARQRARFGSLHTIRAATRWRDLKYCTTAKVGLRSSYTWSTEAFLLKIHNLCEKYSTLEKTFPSPTEVEWSVSYKLTNSSSTTNWPNFSQRNGCTQTRWKKVNQISLSRHKSAKLYSHYGATSHVFLMQPKSHRQAAS